MKLRAKKSSEQSEEMFLGLFVSECGPIATSGIVVDVKSESVDVLILEMATIKRCYVDRIGDKLVQPHRFYKSKGEGKPCIE